MFLPRLAVLSENAVGAYLGTGLRPAFEEPQLAN